MEGLSFNLELEETIYSLELENNVFILTLECEGEIT
jgi:hypothetical protein